METETANDFPRNQLRESGLDQIRRKQPHMSWAVWPDVHSTGIHKLRNWSTRGYTQNTGCLLTITAFPMKKDKVFPEGNRRSYHVIPPELACEIGTG